VKVGNGVNLYASPDELDNCPRGDQAIPNCLFVKPCHKYIATPKRQLCDRARSDKWNRHEGSPRTRARQLAKPGPELFDENLVCHALRPAAERSE
jgi:hypothetical protein